MDCNGCRGTNLADAIFCEHCGDKLQRVCAACATVNTTSSKFCRNCGVRLDGGEQTLSTAAASAADVEGSRSGASAVPVPPHLVERFRLGHAVHLAQHVGERKFITTLFADIKGSMALLDGMDPEAARQLIDPALRLMMNAVYRYEGYVAQVLGDGIVALFGAPIAREDHARRALYAALTMQEQMKAEGARLLREQGLPGLQIRVGINTGEVVVRSIPTDEGRADYTPIGHSVGLAARIEGIAAPGSVVVSDSTHSLTEGYFSFRSLGVVPMKGVVNNAALYEVTGIGALHTRLEVSESHGLSRFVGRRSELERIRALFDLAAGGTGQIAAVMGDAGAGKSRLCHEFKRLVQGECLVLEWRSESYGKAFPYLPLIDMLKRYLTIVAGDDDRRKLEKVTGRVLALDRGLEDTIPFLLALLGVADPSGPIDHMDPLIRRRRTFDAIERVLLREARDRQLLIIMEDLHWLDSESQAFLTLLGRAVGGARMLLLVNYRPEYQPNWDRATSHAQLRLNALGPDDARALLIALLGDAAALGPLKQVIVERTQGNPFFIEEYVRTLFDRGIVKRGIDGVRLAGALSSIEMPPTVQGVLAARIDRLQPQDKAFLQLLAVLGMTSMLRLIESVAAMAPALIHEILDRLRAAEFVHELPTFPDVEYAFNHALTREVAYGELVADAKRSLHSRAALAIEALFADRVEEHCSELAHHYALSDNLPKAIDFLQRAAAQAMRRSAYVAAIEHVTLALALLRGVADDASRDACELPLQSMLGAARMTTRGYAVPEAAQAFERARTLCRDTTETTDLVRVLAGLGLLYINRGELDAARGVGKQLLDLAERNHEPKLVVSAHYILGLTLLRTGELVECRRHMAMVLQHYDDERDGALRYLMSADPRVAAHGFGALALWLAGEQDEALADAAEALRAAHAITPQHPFSLAFAMMSSAWMNQFCGHAPQALREAEAVIEFATDQAFPAWLAHALIVRGWAEGQLGDADAGLAHIEQGLAAYAATGARIWEPLFLLVKAQALRLAQQFAHGLDAIKQARGIAQEIGACWWDAELLRIEGELLLALDPAADEALRCFEQARAVAAAQGARSLELRACMSIARLAERDSNPVPAHLELARVCSGFAAGLNTPELSEARAVLSRAVGVG